MIIKVLKVEEGGRRVRIADVRTEAESERHTLRTRPALAGCEDEGRARSQGCMASRDWKKQGMDSPLEPPVGMQLADALILAQGDPCPNSNLQNCRIINTYLPESRNL